MQTFRVISGQTLAHEVTLRLSQRGYTNFRPARGTEISHTERDLSLLANRNACNSSAIQDGTRRQASVARRTECILLPEEAAGTVFTSGGFRAWNPRRSVSTEFSRCTLAVIPTVSWIPLVYSLVYYYTNWYLFRHPCSHIYTFLPPSIFLLIYLFTIFRYLY